MATISDILSLIKLATGESSYDTFANWGLVQNENLRLLELAAGEVVSKSVTTTDVSLSDDEHNSLLIKATGVLTGNRAIETKDRKGFWFVSNGCTGAFTLTFKTDSGTGIVVPQGGIAILVSDGTDILSVLSLDEDALVTLTGTQTLTGKTLTSPVMTTPQINDTTGDHQYVIAVSELAADRTITLPLLLAADVFVFADFIQTLKNKKLEDSTTTFVDNSDPTKAFKFQVSGVTAGQTREVTVPNKSGTMAMTSDIAAAAAVGDIKFQAGSTVASGWLLCYGQAISRTTYSALFTEISTTYGVGDGSTTFNVPDLRGRVIAGQDDMGGSSANRLTGLSGGLNGDTLGAVGGAESHTLITAEIPAHTHTVPSGGGSVTAGTGGGSAASNTDDDTGSTGGGSAHNNVQPTIVLNALIYAGV